jgi:hypothetical protein
MGEDAEIPRLGEWRRTARAHSGLGTQDSDRRYDRAMKSFVAIAFLLLAPVVSAAETVSFDQARIVLNQNAAIGKPLTDAWEFRKSGTATRLGSRYKTLSGARVGPYEFRARAKGASGEYNVGVRICTTLTFLDAAGNLVKDRHSAAKVREAFKSVLIAPAGAALPSCN